MFMIIPDFGMYMNMFMIIPDFGMDMSMFMSIPDFGMYVEDITRRRYNLRKGPKPKCTKRMPCS
jgi:hypothetical protein